MRCYCQIGKNTTLTGQKGFVLSLGADFASVVANSPKGCLSSPRGQKLIFGNSGGPDSTTTLTMINSWGSLKIKGPGPRAGSSGSYVDEAALRVWTKPRFARGRSRASRVHEAALRTAQKPILSINNYAICWLLCRAKYGFVHARSAASST